MLISTLARFDHCKKLGLLCLVSAGAACGGDSEPPAEYDGGGYVALDGSVVISDGGQDAFVWPFDTGIAFDASSISDGSSASEDGGATDAAVGDGGNLDAGGSDGGTTDGGASDGGNR